MDEYEIDLQDYLKVIWEKKWFILGVLGLFGGTLLAFFANYLKAPAEKQ